MVMLDCGAWEPRSLCYLAHVWTKEINIFKERQNPGERGGEARTVKSTEDRP
jgi:hypothetical protein